MKYIKSFKSVESKINESAFIEDSDKFYQKIDYNEFTTSPLVSMSKETKDFIKNKLDYSEYTPYERLGLFVEEDKFYSYCDTWFYEMKDEWFLVCIKASSVSKYPSIYFKCDQLEGLGLLIDDFSIRIKSK